MSMARLYTFRIDVTPPTGHFICGGLQDPAIATEAPLELRGVVLATGGSRYILAGIDFCYLVDASQRRLEAALAAGAGVPVDQVTVHSGHVHDAPLIHEGAHRLIEQRRSGLILHQEAWFADVLTRAERAVSESVAGDGAAISHFAFASHPVHEFASNRRVPDGKGGILVRWSVTDDAVVRAQPVGLIDPLLDLVTFYGPDRNPVACLSFYACHPQVSNLRRTWSPDTLGVARDIFSQSHPGVFIVHFNGCGGDVTAGKYSTLNKHRNRLVFGLRLFDAMEEAFLKSRPRPLEQVEWRNRVHEIPLRPLTETPDEFDAILRDPVTSIRDCYLASLKMHSVLRRSRTYPYRLSRLRLNDVNMLFLPAEMCVPYQLYAKSRCRGPLAVAAYGDGFLNYIVTDEMFGEGGYEVQPKWGELGPGSEGLIKGYIDDIINDPGDSTDLTPRGESVARTRQAAAT